MDRTWAIVLAAGSGRRFGGSKVRVEAAGRPMVEWALEAARSACDGATLVVPASERESSGELGADVVVAGGETRSASVRAGLATVPEDVDVVVCHDAARPGASAALFEAVIAAVRAGADAAVPVLAVADTLVRVSPGETAIASVAETVDRRDLFAVQTPQAFRRDALVAAHVDNPEATDDAGLVRAQGGAVVAVPGEAAAHKVTTRDDLAIVEALMSQRG